MEHVHLVRAAVDAALASWRLVEVDADLHVPRRAPFQNVLEVGEAAVDPRGVFVEVLVVVDLVPVARDLEAHERRAPAVQGFDVVLARGAAWKHATAERARGRCVAISGGRVPDDPVFVHALESHVFGFQAQGGKIVFDVAGAAFEPEDELHSSVLRDPAQVEFVEPQLGLERVEIAPWRVDAGPALHAGRALAVVEHELRAVPRVVRLRDARAGKTPLRQDAVVFRQHRHGVERGDAMGAPLLGRRVRRNVHDQAVAFYPREPLGQLPVETGGAGCGGGAVLFGEARGVQEAAGNSGRRGRRGPGGGKRGRQQENAWPH